GYTCFQLISAVGHGHTTFADGFVSGNGVKLGACPTASKPAVDGTPALPGSRTDQRGRGSARQSLRFF
ncbi:MAG: hypothetical protein PVJ76_21315, partial [Gemmatimonadota bacterium]